MEGQTTIGDIFSYSMVFLLVLYVLARTGILSRLLRYAAEYYSDLIRKLLGKDDD